MSVSGRSFTVSATLHFFPAHSSVYSANLSAALSKGSLFMQPMKATHSQKNLLHNVVTKDLAKKLLKGGVILVCIGVCIHESRTRDLAGPIASLLENKEWAVVLLTYLCTFYAAQNLSSP